MPSISIILSNILINIWAVARASSLALWWLKAGISSFLAILSRENFFISENNALAIGKVSRYKGLNSIPILKQFSLINPTSKSVFWPTSIESPQNFKKSLITSSILGQSSTISFVIPVISVIFSDITISGLTSWLYSSVIFPFSTLTAPISVILSLYLDKPVVSKSNTTNDVSFM